LNKLYNRKKSTLGAVVRCSLIILEFEKTQRGVKYVFAVRPKAKMSLESGQMLSGQLIVIEPYHWKFVCAYVSVMDVETALVEQVDLNWFK
jgi:hypothetical protein